MERVLNGVRPIISPSFRLHVMHWTRFLRSTAATLPFAVDVELRGIPAHAWEMATAEQLLNDFCWINDMLPTQSQPFIEMFSGLWLGAIALNASPRRWIWRLSSRWWSSMGLIGVP